MKTKKAAQVYQPINMDQKTGDSEGYVRVTEIADGEWMHLEYYNEENDEWNKFYMPEDHAVIIAMAILNVTQSWRWQERPEKSVAVTIKRELDEKV